MDTPIPMLEEFRRLYEAAQAFKEQAPWEWMFEDEIFASATLRPAISATRA